MMSEFKLNIRKGHLKVLSANLRNDWKPCRKEAKVVTPPRVAAVMILSPVDRIDPGLALVKGQNGGPDNQRIRP